MKAKEKDKVKQRKGYWYEFFYEECVLCGRHGEYKRRVYDKPKPDDPMKRHHFDQYVCGQHFC